MSASTVDAICARYGLNNARFDAIDVGLINQTYLVRHGEERFILQRLNPIFAPEVNLDIDAITTRLSERGLSTPRLKRTPDNALWVEHEGAWRMLTFIEGEVQRVAEPEVLRSCGALVAQFHGALASFDHEFHFVREGAHDTPRHLAHLAQVRADLGDGGTLDALSADILELGQDLGDLRNITAPRIIHGDLKLTNIMLHDGHAVALLDLDTMAYGSLAIELGDALRSWCNANGESHGQARLDVARFDAAVAGYAEYAEITDDERDSLVTGFLTITVELASRFGADAYEESYFGWDRETYASAREHNVVRAKTQLSLARQIVDARSQLEELVARRLR